MNFSLINGCGTRGHSFFWSGAYEFTIIIITVAKKSKQTSIRKICNFLQSIGIIAIKNRETRAVIYTCRCCSGHFNPYNSANGLNQGLNCPLEYLQVKMTTLVSLLYSILHVLLLYSDQHWRSTATCAAALELPNLNYFLLLYGLNCPLEFLQVKMTALVSQLFIAMQFNRNRRKMCFKTCI